MEKNSYVNFARLPLRHGLTFGELAKYLSEGAAAYTPPGSDTAVVAPLTVVAMQGWRRDEYFDQTGVKWINPSPNLRSVDEAVLYPGVGMMDATNVSVGRGTATPFEVFGAGGGWFSGKTVADYLTARNLPGVAFAATTFAVAEDANHYPYHGQTVEGVKLTVTDRTALDATAMGMEILAALHHLYPAQFKLEGARALLANAQAMTELGMGDDPQTIVRSWDGGLRQFRQQRTKYLLYP